MKTYTKRRCGRKPGCIEQCGTWRNREIGGGEMKRKIKHTIAYIIVAAWAVIVIYGFASFLWDWIIKPFIEFGIVKSLTILIFVIGVGTVAWFVFWSGEKLVKWLLKE